MREPIHLLLVEDNPGDVLLVRESLRYCSLPVDVTIAEDGTQAQHLLRTGFVPDLIVLDLNVPRMDGYSFLEQSEPSKVPIIVFTWATEGAERALALGARELIRKPSDYAAFVEAVCKIVDNWAVSRASGATAS